MALIKWSGLISEFKGKLNGSVFSQTTYGAMIRNRKSFKGHATTAWNLVKNRLAVNASTWRDLSAANKLTFANEAPNYPYMNKFGVPTTPSAFQLYVTLNNNINFANDGSISTAISPRAEESLGAFSINEHPVNGFNVLYTEPGVATVTIALFCSPPQSKGVTVQPSRMAFINKELGTLAPPIDIDAFIEAKYGAIQIGQQYFFTATVIDTVSGQKYGSYSDSIIRVF